VVRTLLIRLCRDTPLRNYTSDKEKVKTKGALDSPQQKSVRSKESIYMIWVCSKSMAENMAQRILFRHSCESRSMVCICKRHDTVSDRILRRNKFFFRVGYINFPVSEMDRCNPQKHSRHN
jgi:hypothetical protein